MRLKIAFVSDAAYPWHIGGLEAALLAKAKELAKDKRFSVHFFCMRWPGMPEGDFVSDGITYHPFVSTDIDKFYRHRRRSIRTSVFFSVSMARIFKYRFDFLYVNMFPILHIPLLKLYCKLTNCALILDVVEVWTREYWIKYLGGIMGRLAYIYSSYFLDSANSYVTISSTTAEDLFREGIGADRVQVFAPVLDDRALSKFRTHNRRKRVIYYGRLIKEKRLDKWIEAAGSAVDTVRGAEGLIIGNGPEREKVVSAVRRAGLGGRIMVEPFCDDRETMLRRVASSYVFLLMSEREGLSISALEAISLGVPVLLPSYSPIPKEVKQMCVVADDADVPARLVEILRSKDPAQFIKNSGELRHFSISYTRKFFIEMLAGVCDRYGFKERARILRGAG